MSISLLKKELALVWSEPSDFKKQPGKQKRNETLSSNKKGMKKQLRNLKRQGQPQNQRASAKNRVIKSAIEEYKKHSSQDYLQQNLKYMLGNHSAANQDVVQKILSQHTGRKAKDRKEKKRKMVQEKSMFSDSDFKRFEKEYFGSRQVVPN